jgi:hypothetical protein
MNFFMVDLQIRVFLVQIENPPYERYERKTGRMREKGNRCYRTRSKLTTTETNMTKPIVTHASDHRKLGNARQRHAAIFAPGFVSTGVVPVGSDVHPLVGMSVFEHQARRATIRDERQYDI